MFTDDNTALIHLATRTYPVTMAQMKQSLSHVSFSQQPTEEQLRSFGYAVVVAQERPTGDVVVEHAPMQNGEHYAQVLSTRAFNSQELQHNLNQQKRALGVTLQTLRDAALSKGCAYTFAEDTVGHIQLRDGDRANLTGLRLKASALVDQGVVAAVLAFRTYENTVHLLTPAQMVALTDVASDAYMALLQQVWAYKDQIDAAPSAQALPALPSALTA